MRQSLSKPQRRAYALAYAMRERPTPDLAREYFDALREMLNERMPVRHLPAGESGPDVHADVADGVRGKDGAELGAARAARVSGKGGRAPR